MARQVGRGSKCPEALLLARTASICLRPVDQTGLAARSEADHPGHQDPARALPHHLDHRSPATPGPRTALAQASGPARPRPRRLSTRPGAGPSSYPRPLLRPPPRDRLLVAFDRPVRGHLRRPAQPVQQIRHPTRGVPVAEQAMDQLRDPGKGPPLVLHPAVRGRASLQLDLQTFRLAVAELTRKAAGPLRPCPMW